MPTLLCVPIMVRDVASALAGARAAGELGADLVEFRIDDIFSGSGDATEERAVLGLVADSPLPCIVTCRPAFEGGGYDGDDAARVALYERLGTAGGAGEHPPRYIDVELATYARSANLRQKVDLAVDHPGQRRDLRTSLILSVHDFQGRPADLTRRVLALKGEPAAKVHKIAFRARSLRDNLELFEILGERDRPTIALGMGEFGLMSRVLAPKFGGFLTFASLRDSSATAPGQPTVGDLLNVYRFREIGARTKVYGVVGWPVSHSMSPQVHNAGFAETGHDGVYVPMPVAPGAGIDDGYASFKATVGEMIEHPSLDLAGLSVTMPHKENLVRLARERGWELDAASAAIGAGNTLHAERDGTGRVIRGRVFNTDVAAFKLLLGESVDRRSVSGADRRRVAVVGAGGVGRAAAYAMASAGTRVEIYNRTPERAEELARLVRGAVAGAEVAAFAWSRLEESDAGVFIHCTSVGMSGATAVGDARTDTSVIPVREISARNRARGREILAMETVYAPPETPFLREARAGGWRTIDGVSMFVAQAAEQFEAWTGRPAPVQLFERIVRTGSA